MLTSAASSRASRRRRPGSRTAGREERETVAPDDFSFATCDRTSDDDHLVVLGGDHLLPPRQTALQPEQQILAVAVVLESTPTRAPGSGARGTCPKIALGLVARLEADRVRVLGRVRAEGRVAGRGEELRHLHRVQVVARGEVLLGAERVEDREDVVLLDELPGLLRPCSPGCRRRRERVVDLAAEHAARSRSRSWKYALAPRATATRSRQPAPSAGGRRRAGSTSA